MKKYIIGIGLLVACSFVVELSAARAYGTYPVNQNISQQYRGSRTTRSYRTPNRSVVPQNIRIGKNYSGRSRDVLFGRFYADNKVTYRTDGIFFAVAGGSYVSDKNGNGQNTDAEDLSETFRDFKLYINNQYVDYVSDFSVYRGRVGVWFDTAIVLEPKSQIQLVGEISRYAETGDKVRFNLRRDGIIGAEVY